MNEKENFIEHNFESDCCGASCTEVTQTVQEYAGASIWNFTVNICDFCGDECDTVERE